MGVYKYMNQGSDKQKVTGEQIAALDCDSQTGEKYINGRHELTMGRHSSSGSVLYCVQTGAYSQRANGDAQAAKMKARDFEGALANGIAVGCYFYSYALTVEAVKKEEAFVIQQLAKYKGRILYPIAFDIEGSTQAELGKQTPTDMVTAFCSALEAAGYYASTATQTGPAIVWTCRRSLASTSGWPSGRLRPHIRGTPST